MVEPPTAAPLDDGAEALVRYGTELVQAVEVAIGPWVTAAVAARHPQPWSDDVAEATVRAAAAATAEIPARLRELLTLDIDDQWTNPLAIIRTSIAYPTEVLRRAGVATVPRDDDDIRINPDDVYALAPASFADLGPRVHEPGIAWGAAKAHVHLRRRRRLDSPSEGEGLGPDAR